MASELSRANLRQAVLVQTNLADTDLTGCHIYGVSAWEVAKEQNNKT